MDYGWLTFLAKPIYWLLSFLYGIVGNWGWAIVLLTCIVKAILYPLSLAGYRSMAKMKDLGPRLPPDCIAASRLLSLVLGASGFC